MLVYLFTLLFVHTSIWINAEATECNQAPGYYWRDYTGEIPDDALSGGTNSKGHTTYIGQTLHLNLIIPAKIDPDDKQVTYEWGYKEYQAEQNIKILCTQHPEQFEWVSTGNRQINTIRNKTFVIAGYEPGIKSLIGRKQLGNELVIGKVVFTQGQSTLNTSKDGVGTQHGEFEVLCYNPNSKISTNTRTATTATKGNKSTRPIVISFYY